MKKFAKVMLILAAVFAAVGIGLAAAGAAMGAGAQSMEAVESLRARFGDTFDYFYGEAWEEVDSDDVYEADDADDYKDSRDESFDDNDNRGKTLEGTSRGDSRVYQVSEVEKLDINLKYDELFLREQDGTGITVEVQNDPKALVRVKESGNTLKITSSGKLEKKRQVLVSYPKNMKFREVELGVGAGNVAVESDLHADKLDVAMGAGEFTNFGTITTRKTELEVGAGSMNVKGLKTVELDGQCGVGDLTVEVNGKESDYSYSLECGIGNITLGDNDYSGLGKEQKINNPGASGEIDLECGIGNISVTFAEN